MLNLVTMDEVVTSKSNRLKLAKGDARRISFVLFPGFDTGNPDFSKMPLFARARRVYAQGIGNIIDEGPASKITGLQSKEYFATIIALWPTAPGSMKPLTSTIVNDNNFELKYWVMTKTRMEEIKKAHGMTGAELSTADLGVVCDDEQYQKLQIQSLPQSLYHTFCTSDKTKDFASVINRQIQSMVDALESQIGMRLTADEIRQRWSTVSQDVSENTSNAMGNVPSSVVVPPGVAASDADEILSSL